MRAKRWDTRRCSVEGPHPSNTYLSPPSLPGEGGSVILSRPRVDPGFPARPPPPPGLLVAALILLLAAPTASAAALWVRDDTGTQGDVLDFDFSDDTARKRLVLTAADLTGATTAKLWVHAQGQNCGAAAGTIGMSVNGGAPFATFDPCTVWGAAAPSWGAVPVNVPLASLAAGTNAFETSRTAGLWTDRAVFFGLDTSVDFGRSDALANGVNKAGELMWCLEITTTGAGGGYACQPCVAVPGAPALTVTYVATLKAQLDWTAAATACPPKEHEVQRSVAGGPWATIATLPGTTLAHLDVGLSECTAYDYRVRLLNAAGWGPYSNVAGIVTPALTPPGAPTLAAANGPPVSAALAWTAAGTACPPITGYEIDRRIGAGAWATIANVNGATLTHNDPGLANCATYDYRVRASNAVGWGPYSNIASVTTPTVVPNMPQNVGVALLDPVTARVDWDPPAANGCPVDSYNVARWIGPAGPLGLMGSVAAPTTQYDDAPLVPCLTYVYYVQAVNAAGLGLFSPAVFYTHDPLGVC